MPVLLDSLGFISHAKTLRGAIASRAPRTPAGAAPRRPGRVPVMTRPTPATLAHHRAGQGSPLVLLHPLGADRHVWDAVMPFLATRRELIAIDLPGFGESPALDGPLPTPRALAAAWPSTWRRSGSSAPISPATRSGAGWRWSSDSAGWRAASAGSRQPACGPSHWSPRRRSPTAWPARSCPPPRWCVATRPGRVRAALRRRRAPAARPRRRRAPARAGLRPGPGLRARQRRHARRPLRGPGADPLPRHARLARSRPSHPPPRLGPRPDPQCRPVGRRTHADVGCARGAGPGPHPRQRRRGRRPEACRACEEELAGEAS